MTGKRVRIAMASSATLTRGFASSPSVSSASRSRTFRSAKRAVPYAVLFCGSVMSVTSSWPPERRVKSDAIFVRITLAVLDRPALVMFSISSSAALARSPASRAGTPCAWSCSAMCRPRFRLRTIDPRVTPGFASIAVM